MPSQAYIDGLKRIGVTDAPTDFNAIQDRSLLAPAAKPVKQPNFSPSNLLHTAGSVITGTAGAIGQSLGADFHNVASGIVQGLPGGQIEQNQHGYDQALRDLQHAQEAYTKQYSLGKISKQRYNALLKDLSAQHEALNKHIEQTTADYVKPRDFVQSTVNVASLPFAVGSLAASGTLASAAEGTGALSQVGKAGQAAERVLGGVKAGQQSLEAIQAAKSPGVVGSLLKAPIKALLNRQTGDQAVQAASDVYHGKYGAAASSAAQFGALAAVPGVLGKYGPKVAEAAGKAFFGKAGSAINDLKFADGTVSNFLSTLSGPLQKKYEALARQVNQRMLDEKKSAGAVAAYYANGNKIGKQTVQEFLDQAAQHIAAEKAIIKDTAKGVTGLEAPAGHAVIASRWDTATRATVVERLKNGATVQSLIKEGILPNNPNLVKEIEAKVAAGEIEGVNKIYAARNVGATESPELNQLLDETTKRKDYKGYVPGIGPKAAANYKTIGKTAELVAPIAPGKVLGKVGAAITKAGLSPQAADTQALTATVKGNFAKELNSINENLDSKTGNIIYGKLIERAQQTRGVTDIRLLSKRTITQVLDDVGVTGVNASQVKKSLAEAYLHVPAALQGAGGKLTSAAIRYVPGEKSLLKAQSYGRFALNPIFAAKVGVKSAYLGALESHGDSFLGPVSKDVAKYVGKSKQLGGMVEDALGNPGATASGGFGVAKIQQNIAGNLVQNILERNGAKLDDIAKNPALKQQIDHAVQTIYGYPKGGILSSNLMKSLNVAVFPARFEAKVLGATAKAIIDQPPIMRAAVLNGLIKGSNWLESPDGQQWKKDNAEFYDVVKYFTPTDTLGKTMSILTGNKEGLTVKDLGAIGGLPFGVITEILSHQGVPLGPFKSSPYVPTKTGVAIPEQIPKSVKARAATAMADIINQMWSYPGQTIGLKSKASITRSAVDILSNGNLKSSGGDFETVGGDGATSKAAPVTGAYHSLSFPTAKVPSIVPVVKPGRGIRVKPKAKHLGQPL